MCAQGQSLFDDDATAATISEIEPLPSDPNMRRIRVGRRTMATLRAADIDLLHLRVGQPWTESCAKAVLAEVAANKARKDALHMLGRRAYSHGEIIQKLLRKGYDQKTAMRIADELAADRWIDDEAYGQAIVERTSKKAPAGEQLLLAKLRKRKVRPEVAQQLAREAAGNNPVEKAMEMARDRLADWESMPPAKAARRIASMLARRGFDEQVVADVIEKLRLNTDAD